MPTSMACDELACCRIRNCCCIWARLVFNIGLELNSEGNNFSFICCAKQRTILLGVPRAWRVLHDHRLSDLEWSFFFNDYNLRSFCKHLRSMQHFFSNSRILFCCFKRSRAFLSSLFFSTCIFLFIPCGAK